MSLLRILLFFVREAYVNLRRSWRVSLLAVFTITTSLFVGGLFLLLSENLARLLEEWRGQAKVIVYLSAPLPVDERNERWMQLRRHPTWSFYGPEYPDRAELLAQRDRVVKRHPDTIFIGAHIGSDAGDLAAAARTMAAHPNYYVDISGRMGELAGSRTPPGGSSSSTRTVSSSAPTAFPAGPTSLATGSTTGSSRRPTSTSTTIATTTRSGSSTAWISLTTC